ncbi:hypothetical protein H0I76_18555 [Limibaculum sp. M0105]|uniref:Uncharacterized protein n=1 Tax=Thermohalobaculum xanthum TaxID=2753746 RepID=A0A8J7MB97_9RHOB|nr:hypothetical protein [Thermohalobaculum xanthum]MBK0401205.1 hypothetical protein [Thermohalobaculum xanthum]
MEADAPVIEMKDCGRYSTGIVPEHPARANDTSPQARNGKRILQVSILRLTLVVRWITDRGYSTEQACPAEWLTESKRLRDPRSFGNAFAKASGWIGSLAVGYHPEPDDILRFGKIIHPQELVGDPVMAQLRRRWHATIACDRGHSVIMRPMKGKITDRMNERRVAFPLASLMGAMLMLSLLRVDVPL